VSIVGGLDVHRRQITSDWVDRATGQAQRGQITPATREGLGRWLAQLPDHHGGFAVEACMGWRFVVEDLQDRLPQAWIPPAHLLELRVLVRLRKTLVDQRTAWQQRLHAVLFHHGLPCPDHALLTQATCSWLEQVALPQASRLQVTTALGQIDQLDLELEPLERWLRAFARRQPGCRALIDRHYGIGMLIAPTILAELGDARRFANGDAIVRHTGLDVTAHSSDHKRSPGHLSRQGPPVLRWALFEAAQCAARPTSSDHDLYTQVKTRIDGNRAALTVARKLARRVRHTLPPRPSHRRPPKTAWPRTPDPQSSILSPDPPAGGFEHPDKDGRWHAQPPMPSSGGGGPMP
jgi:transposase